MDARQRPRSAARRARRATASSSPTWPSRHNPARIIPAWREFVDATRRPGPRHRRADLARPRRAPSWSSASSTSRCSTSPSPTERLPAAVPVRHVALDERVHPRGVLQPPGRGRRAEPHVPRRARWRRSTPLPPPPAAARMLGFELDDAGRGAPAGRAQRAPRRLAEPYRTSCWRSTSSRQQHPPRRRPRDRARLARPTTRSSARCATAAASRDPLAGRVQPGPRRSSAAAGCGSPTRSATWSRSAPGAVRAHEARELPRRRA